MISTSARATCAPGTWQGPVARTCPRDGVSVHVIRLGRISYVNMAPVFYRLEAEVDEIVRRSDRAEPAAARREASTWRRSRRSSTRATPTGCASCRGSASPPRARWTRSSSSRACRSSTCGRSRSRRRARRRSCSRRCCCPRRSTCRSDEEADARLLIGDAALKSAFEDPTPHFDLGRLWLERTGLPMVFAVWAAPEPVAAGLAELEDALVASVRLARAEPERLAYEAARALRLPGRLPRALLREAALLASGRASAPGLVTFLELATRRGRARRACRSCASSREEVVGVSSIVSNGQVRGRPRSSTRRSTGERISDDEALDAPPLARPRRGRPRRERAAQPQERSRAGHVHRRPQPQLHERLLHRLRLLRLLPQPGRPQRGLPAAEAVIFKKIEETLAIGGTGLLMQGGHHPDLGIDYYEDLFRSIKARYPVHLHALSPPEVQHVARRSKLTILETLSRLRDAGLDSLPGGGGRDPRRPRPRHHRAEEDDRRRVARHHAPRAPARHVDDRDDDVRPRRDGRGAGRAHAPHPRAPGRAARLPRVHLVDVPGRRQPPRREGAARGHADLVRLPAHPGRVAHLPRQRRPHPVVVGDAGD